MGRPWGAAPRLAPKPRRIWKRRNRVSHRGFIVLGVIIAAFAFSPSQAAAHAYAHPRTSCLQTTPAG
jgi:hypothetical protein